MATSLRRPLAIFATSMFAAAFAPYAGAAQVVLSDDSWRLSAAAGAFVPHSSIIVSADGRDTRLRAGPAFALDAQYLAMRWGAIYATGTAAFSSLAIGDEIQPDASGSERVMVTGITGGVLLHVPLESALQPTFRVGGGIKGYAFDLAGAESQWRPTADVGIGFRGFASGPLEVSAEIRYLPSSFDQGRLPIRGIISQEQRQTDLLFTVGVSVRQ